MTYKIGNNIPLIEELENRDNIVTGITIGNPGDPIFSGLTRLSKCKEADEKSICQNVWALAGAISKMSRQEIHLYFGVPTTEVFDLPYNEAKQKYDAWYKANAEAAEKYNKLMEESIDVDFSPEDCNFQE